MNWNDNKLEITVVGLTAFAVVGLFGLGNSFHMKPGMKMPEIDYVMHRPVSTNYNEFSVDGRQINRSSVAAAGKAKLHETASKPEVKKDDAKKAVTQTATPKTSNTIEGKTSEVSVNVVGGSNESGSYSMASTAAPHNGANQGNTIAAGDVAAADQQNKDQEDTMTEAQWKALLYSQPTHENFAKLMTAVQNKKVSEAFAYNLMAELFKTQQQTTQANIISVLPGNSATAFRFAVQMSPNAQGGVADKLNAYVATYGSKDKFAALNQVLVSQDSVSVTKALDLISETMSKQVVSTETYAGRSNRDTAAGLTAQDFALFTTNLQSLAKSNSSEIAHLAADLLGQLPATPKNVVTKTASLTSTASSL